MVKQKDNPPEKGPEPARTGKHRPPANKGDGAARRLPPEVGGPRGPEPTRYGDWERKGIASDF